MEEMKQYEIKMYKLLVLVFAGVFIAILLGYYFGDRVGKAEAINNICVTVPDYCTSNMAKGNIVIKCNELENLSANEVCSMLSTPLKSKIRVVVAI